MSPRGRGRSSQTRLARAYPQCRSGHRPTEPTPPTAPQDLLVVRELCHPGSGTAAAWFGNDAVSWHLPDTYLDEPVLTPTAVFVGNLTWMLTGQDHAPPVALLRFLSRLSSSTDTVISLFCAQTWGGTFEYAYAWVFEGRSGAGKVYVLPCDLEKGDVPGVRVWDPRLPDHPREIIVDGDVLTLVLDHYGIALNGGFFEPHTRAFDWNQHRIC
jgi:hypothetical protein